MTAKEIRQLMHQPHGNFGFGLLWWRRQMLSIVFLLGEIAAQLAELNESQYWSHPAVDSLKHRVSILESEVKSLEHRKIG